MTLISAERSRREEKYYEEEERLSKDTENTIAYFNIREIADRDLKEILSKPLELMGSSRRRTNLRILL
jgi:hypothetical protein